MQDSPIRDPLSNWQAIELPECFPDDSPAPTGCKWDSYNSRSGCLHSSAPERCPIRDFREHGRICNSD